MSFVPSAFAQGGQCAGHGVCVDSFRQAGLLLCKCDSWYNGASDFFDNRVEQLSDGTWLSFSCQSSLVGTYVIWGFFMLCGLIRLKPLIPLWCRFYKKHFADPKKVQEGIFRDVPLVIVSIDLFAITIPHFILAICKLGFNMTLGTDALPTVMLVLHSLFSQIRLSEVSRAEFNVFVIGSTSPEEAKQAKMVRTCLKATGQAIMIGLTMIPTLISLGLNRNLGPIENNSITIIYLRNLGVLVYLGFDMMSTWMIRQRLRKILAFSQRDASLTSSLISKMNEDLKAYFRVIIVAAIFYIVFVIPLLLSHQTYCIGFMIGLGALRHSGSVFISKDEEEKAREGGTTKIDPSRMRPSISSIPSGGSKQEGPIILIERGSEKSDSKFRLSCAGKNSVVSLAAESSTPAKDTKTEDLVKASAPVSDESDDKNAPHVIVIKEELNKQKSEIEETICGTDAPNHQ